jgi:hypothetical protein
MPAPVNAGAVAAAMAHRFRKPESPYPQAHCPPSLHHHDAGAAPRRLRPWCTPAPPSSTSAPPPKHDFIQILDEVTRQSDDFMRFGDEVMN